MELVGKKIGFALTGSFCTLSRAVKEIQTLVDKGADVVPIMSGIVYSTDTRFGRADELRETVKKITGNDIINTIAEAEPIGPKKLLDMLIIEPCTGCTLAKIANGVTDTSVTMACKAHLRNNRPVVIAVSTNDGLSGSAKNIGALMSCKNIYFVPFGQDDFVKKPTSLVADMTQTAQTAELAFDGRQLQPILC
jgi:dipicolinate synthase subunit B